MSGSEEAPGSTAPGSMARGGCLCGAVRYEAERPLRDAIACHCGQCLRCHGNFAVYTAVPAERLRLVEDRGLRWYQSSAIARRGFCGECGASLFWDPAGAGYLAVSAGSLDQPSGIALSGHIFVADKPDFYEITDGLVRHPGSMSLDRQS